MMFGSDCTSIVYVLIVNCQASAEKTGVSQLQLSTLVQLGTRSFWLAPPLKSCRCLVWKDPTLITYLRQPTLGGPRAIAEKA
jgi:hypothetical protein